MQTVKTVGVDQKEIISINTNLASKKCQEKAENLLNAIALKKSSYHECEIVINHLTNSNNLILAETLKNNKNIKD